MARIEIDPNYSSPTFSRATAPTDLFKKEDIQGLASAMSVHNHTATHGLPITGTSGAFSVGGTLTVSGATTLSNTTVGGTLSVVGGAAFNNVTLNTTLGVAGTSTLATTTITTLTVSGITNLGNTGVTGTLNVTGATTLASLGVTGGLNVGGNVAITGGVGIGTTLTVTGAFTASGGIADPKITGQVQIGGGSATLPTVTGNAGLWRYLKAFAGNMTVNLTSGSFYLGNTAYASGAYTLTSGDSVGVYCDGSNWHVI